MSTNSRGPSALKGMQRSLSQRVSCSDIGRGAGVGILLITIACGGGATLSETRGPDAPVSSAVHPLSPTVESSPVPVVTAAAARNDWMTLGARAAVASSGAAPPASVNERAERELLGAERPASPPAPVGERSETPRSEEPVAHSPEHVGLEPAAEMVIPEEYLVQPGDTLSRAAQCEPVFAPAPGACRGSFAHTRLSHTRMYQPGKGAARELRARDQRRGCGTCFEMPPPRQGWRISQPPSRACRADGRATARYESLHYGPDAIGSGHEIVPGLQALGHSREPASGLYHHGRAAADTPTNVGL